LGSLRKPLVIIGDLRHCALTFGISYLFRDSASFLGAVEQRLASLIE
jgi:hypothetical protein